MTGAFGAECVYDTGRYSEGAVACLPTVVDNTRQDRLHRCQDAAWVATNATCEGAAAEAFCSSASEQLSLRIGSTQIDVCRPTGLMRVTTHDGTDVVLDTGGQSMPPPVTDETTPPPVVADGDKIKRVKAFITEEAAGDEELELCPDAACTAEFDAEVRDAVVKYLRLPANRDAAIDADFRSNWGNSTTAEELFAHVAAMSDAQLVASFIETFPVP